MKPIRRQCCDSLFDGRHGWQIEYGKEVLFMRGGSPGVSPGSLCIYRGIGHEI